MVSSRVILTSLRSLAAGAVVAATERPGFNAAAASAMSALDCRTFRREVCGAAIVLIADAADDDVDLVFLWFTVCHYRKGNVGDEKMRTTSTDHWACTGMPAFAHIHAPIFR
jgi:hypothetical protein